MDKHKRKAIKRGLIGISLIWMAAAGWVEFARLPTEAVQTHSSQSVKDRMQDECQGSFQQRYECKESIVLETSQDTFFNLSGRLLVVILVPLLAAVGYRTLCKPDPEIYNRPVHDDMSWKKAAQTHINKARPPEEPDDYPHG